MVNSDSAAGGQSPLTGPKGDVYLLSLSSTEPEINPIKYYHPLTRTREKKKNKAWIPFLPQIYLMVVEVMFSAWGGQGKIWRVSTIRRTEGGGEGRKCTPPRRGPHSEHGAERSTGERGGWFYRVGGRGKEDVGQSSGWGHDSNVQRPAKRRAGVGRGWEKAS